MGGGFAIVKGSFVIRGTLCNHVALFVPEPLVPPSTASSCAGNKKCHKNTTLLTEVLQLPCASFPSLFPA